MESRESRPPTQPGRSSITLQISPGALALAAALLGLTGALLIALAFFAGMLLRPAEQASAAVTVVAVLPTEPPPGSAGPTAAPVAYPAPASQAAPPTQQLAPTPAEAPVFAPIRPTSALERGFTAPEPPAVTPTPPDFQIAPAGAQPAATVAVVADAVDPAPAAQVAPSATAALPTEEPPAPTAAAPRSAAADRQSGDDTPGGAQPTPRAPAAHAMRGNVTWGPENGPIVLNGDVEIARGATLIIREGTEVQVPRGASFVVHGNLYVLGSAARPARITQVGGDRSQRWEAIFARPGSSIALNNADILGGGAGGTLLGAELSDIKIRGVRLIGNGGQIRTVDSRVEIRDVQMYDNEIPYGAAIDVTFSRGGNFILTSSRLVRNYLTSGAAPVLVTNQSFSHPATLEIVGNLLVGQDGPNLQLFTNAQMQGNITCNTLVGGANGLSLRSDGPPNLSPMLNLRDNSIEGHTPPIIAIYLEFGIGRGATSDLPLGMANNWWELPNGPFEPDRNNPGRGESVGENIAFEPWLTERPGCAPNL